MNVKEFKEFLKDIDDDVEVFAFQEKYENAYCHFGYDSLTLQDLSVRDNKLFIS